MMVYISGIAGFVGRHFAKRLADEGHYVVGCDDFSSGVELDQWAFSPNKTDSFHIQRDDFRESVKHSDAGQYDLILHCAAVVGGRATIDNNPLAVATNFALDSAFFQWVLRTKTPPKCVIYFSSSAVYPVELQRERMHCTLAESLVTTSGHRIGMPDQIYGFAKLAGEVLMRQAVSKYGVPIVCYRPFSGYGEDQSFDYPFPSLIKRVVDKEDPIEVWGTGEQVRDFIHIDDIIEGVLSTCWTLPAGTTMNLGSGLGISFKDLIDLAAEMTNHKYELRPLTDKPVGVHRRQADTFFMRQHFTPKVGLEEGVLRMISYLQSWKERVA